jgi:hypothetical protein
MAEYEITIPLGETLLVPKPVAWHTDDDGNVIAEETQSIPRHQGDVVDESEIASHILKALDEGDDERLNGLFSKVGAEPKEKPKTKAQLKKEEDEDAKMRAESALAEQQRRNEAAKAAAE